MLLFRSRAEAEKAIAHMTRAMLGSQRIRCGWAQHRQETFWTSCAAVDGVISDSPPGNQQRLSCAFTLECAHSLAFFPSPKASFILQAEPDSTNVYIGNISAEVTDEQLQQLANQFGVVVDMRLHRKGGYAFVQVYSSDTSMLAIS